MTYLLIQEKNRRDDRLTKGLRNEAKEGLKSAAALLSSNFSHIAILMSLRSKGGQQEMEVVREYVWSDMNRVVIAAVGLDLDLYPGLAWDWRQPKETKTVEIISYLNRLLRYHPSDMPTSDDDKYRDCYKHLSPLG
ncbi:hypothetical protein VTN77DRAFT_6740 [Rasamsonia byssochlamydoides]|uniref:uncharacterized protein n=1 Tax=Rasamsonia byssochlamydoides TaxID=89139 RepID=UPI0037438270